MTRESVEGMVRTALVTHNARFGMKLVEPNLLARTIADAILAQQEHEVQDRFTESEWVLEPFLPGGDESSGDNLQLAACQAVRKAFRLAERSIERARRLDPSSR